MATMRESMIYKLRLHMGCIYWDAAAITNEALVDILLTGVSRAEELAVRVSGPVGGQAAIAEALSNARKVWARNEEEVVEQARKQGAAEEREAILRIIEQRIGTDHLSDCPCHKLDGDSYTDSEGNVFYPLTAKEYAEVWHQWQKPNPKRPS